MALLVTTEIRTVAASGPIASRLVMYRRLGCLRDHVLAWGRAGLRKIVAAWGNLDRRAGIFVLVRPVDFAEALFVGFRGSVRLAPRHRHFVGDLHPLAVAACRRAHRLAVRSHARWHFSAHPRHPAHFWLLLELRIFEVFRLILRQAGTDQVPHVARVELQPHVERPAPSLHFLIIISRLGVDDEFDLDPARLWEVETL